MQALGEWCRSEACDQIPLMGDLAKAARLKQTRKGAWFGAPVPSLTHILDRIE
jgi:hypothetical protein